jgi:hypothetical protein
VLFAQEHLRAPPQPMQRANGKGRRQRERAKWRRVEEAGDRFKERIAFIRWCSADLGFGCCRQYLFQTIIMGRLELAYIFARIIE